MYQIDCMIKQDIFVYQKGKYILENIGQSYFDV